MMSFKCKACATAASFHGRHEALAAGWTTGELQAKDRIRYFVFCPKCGAATEWLKKAMKD